MPDLSAKSFQASRALRGVAAFAAVCALQGGAVLLLGRGLACPFRALTGLLCPVCGSTTAGLHLLRGQWGQAWAANPLMLLVAAGLAICTVLWTVEAAGGPAVRPPRVLRPLTADRVLVVLGAVGLAFGLWRNLV